MAENPLLPHQRLKDLYELMKRVRASAGTPRRAEADREAVFAAAAIQLEQGDVLCGSQGESTLFALPDTKKNKATPSTTSGMHTCALRDTDLPALCDVLAAGMKSAEKQNAVIGVSSTDSGAAWASVLEHAQAERLPLLLILTDRPSSTTTAKPSDITWASMTKIAKKLQLPTISVDGEDAVALYRVIQESLHRARHGDGPAIIWCSYMSQPASNKASRSIVNMESYLAARGLLAKTRTNRLRN